MVLPKPPSSPTAHLSSPPLYYFSFPPAAEPQALSPPASDRTFARPFSIDAKIYNDALHVTVPITIALVYATTVTILNRVNSRRQYQPWSISESLPFYFFVLFHNVLLAVFSAWTCLGMLNAYTQSWPGWNGEHGLVGAIDALCKIHGPRGLGRAATFNYESGGWGFTDRSLKLLDGSPDSTDVGRIWNEGLAFYGWLFYVSKFYETIDTFIILAKGKRTSLLQTFHHAGAMMCMWAGIRYMSPPIWMFVFINSGLHTMMYTYYTLLTLSIPIPWILKKTLTSLQIVQFVFGASYAISHLFIVYSIPVSVPYLSIHNLSSALPKVTSSVSSAVASATATAGLGSWLKKAALRAAGEEGLAENVRNRQGETFGIDAIHAADVEKAQEEIKYKVEYQTIRCLDTSGEAFAILLNAVYLAPLTILFINFFLETYIRRVRAAPPPPDRKQITKDSSQEALKKVEEEIREAMAEGNNNEINMPPDLKIKLEKARANLEAKTDDLGSKFTKTAQSTSDALNEKLQATKGMVEKKVEGALKNDENVAKTWNQEEKEDKEDDEERSDEHPDSKPEDEQGDGEAEAYEVNPDVLKSEEEKRAEEEFQPDGV